MRVRRSMRQRRRQPIWPKFGPSLGRCGSRVAGPRGFRSLRGLGQVTGRPAKHDSVTAASDDSRSRLCRFRSARARPSRQLLRFMRMWLRPMGRQSQFGCAFAGSDQANAGRSRCKPTVAPPAGAARLPVCTPACDRRSRIGWTAVSQREFGPWVSASLSPALLSPPSPSGSGKRTTATRFPARGSIAERVFQAWRRSDSARGGRRRGTNLDRSRCLAAREAEADSSRYPRLGRKGGR